ncbi:TolC family protein [Microbulbifer salipaludis]|uniref:TolC family protein n=1 Tax=Microbulbifer salipaludis TaxID=187980 RepID=A0ABS3E8Q3_9GAMM|nr:TolC family protein [Microbulbifer salipaludis]MBN8431578.1 TolC family protein [Microbulbifer salipaludis]
MSLSLCLDTSISWAQESPVYRGLTFEQAVMQSLQSHLELAGYSYQLESANAQAAQAAVGPRPELRLQVEDVAGTGDFNGVESAQTTLGITWLFQSNVIDKRVEAARIQTSVIETQRQVLELDVAANTARYFLQAMAQQERMVLAMDAVEQAQEALVDIRRQVSVGKVPQADASRAEAELERRRLAVEDIGHELQVSRHRLAAQWGERTPGFGAVDGSLSAPVPAIDIARLRSEVSGNPNLAVFLSRERVAEAEIALARAEAGIQWKIDAGIRRLESVDDYSLVAGVSIPLGRRDRNKNKVAALMAEQNRYRAERDAKALEMETQVYVMAQELLHSRHVAEALEVKIIPSLQRALTDTRSAYRQGKYSYYELAAAQQDLIEARLSYLETQYRAHLNLIEIEKLTGLSLAAISENVK